MARSRAVHEQRRNTIGSLTSSKKGTVQLILIACIWLGFSISLIALYDSSPVSLRNLRAFLIAICAGKVSGTRRTTATSNAPPQMAII